MPMAPHGGRFRDLARATNATTAVEFAICALVMMLVIVGFVEIGRLAWTFEVLQEAAFEGARCMGTRATSCAAAGVYNSANTKTYVIGVATARGVTITAPVIVLNNAANCGGAANFSQVAINYSFTSVAPGLLTALAGGYTVATSACFPNSS